MKKFPAILLIIFIIAMTIFTTRQFYLGNLEAAFSSLPFLLIVYFFVKSRG